MTVSKKVWFLSLMTLGCNEGIISQIDFPPTAPGVSIEPSQPLDGEGLFCEVVRPSTDRDGDEIEYTFKWFQNNEESETTGPEIPEGVTATDDSWRCEVTPWSLGKSGEKGVSDVDINARNQPPGPPGVAIEPSDPQPEEGLYCAIHRPSLDMDGDAVTYSYEWWRTDSSGDSVRLGFTESKIPAGETRGLDNWTCVVTPNDGEADGESAADSVDVDCIEGTHASCPGASCLDILEQGVSTGDGIYWLGNDDTEAYEAYCDMTTDGGGWTLTMKLDDQSAVFEYDAAYWTQVSLLNEADVMPNVSVAGENAKYRSFNEVTGMTMRLEFVSPAHNIHFRDLRNQTLLELFSYSDEISIAENDPYGSCSVELKSVEDYNGSIMRFASGPQFFGVNGLTSGSGTTASKLRFGFASNDETYNAWYGSVAIGSSSDWLGTTHHSSVIWYAAQDCYNNCSCYGSGSTVSDTAANLWVR